MLRKYALRLRWGRRHQGIIHFAIGQQMCLHGDMVEARRALLRALRFNPLQVRAYVYLVVSLGGPETASRLWALVRKVRGIHPADR